MSKTLAMSLLLIMLGLVNWEAMMDSDQLAQAVSSREGEVRVQHDGTSYPPK